MINQVQSPLASQIAALLLVNASLSANELQAATGKSQPSISLAIAQLGDRVCKLGAARSTRYALTKDILGLPANQSLHFTDEVGRISEFGTLTQLHNRQIVVRAKSRQQWISAPGELPWFLKPLRPQGFLGRQYSQLRPDFPGDPETWTAEQALYIAANHATDPPGAFGLGEITGRPLPESPSEIGARALHYDRLAVAIANTLPAGSSAGGEQPKFLIAFSENAVHHHLIVKFTPPRNTPFGKRWRALLHLEHLAQTILTARERIRLCSICGALTEADTALRPRTLTLSKARSAHIWNRSALIELAWKANVMWSPSTHCTVNLWMHRAAIGFTPPRSSPKRNSSRQPNSVPSPEFIRSANSSATPICTSAICRFSLMI